MSVQEVRVPDLGDFKNIPVVEVLVKVGDTVAAEAPIVTLESDKATMEVPTPIAGVVKEIKVKAGDKVSLGSLVLLLDVAGGAAAAPPAPASVAPVPAAAAPVAAAAPAAAAAAPAAAAVPAPIAAPALVPAVADAPVDSEAFKLAHAGPGVRALARELGVDLGKLAGTGLKGRIVEGDVTGWVKAALAAAAAAPAGGAVAGLDLAAWPKVDFAKFGPIETRPLARLRKIAGRALHRNWVQIPHVTNHEDADVTELEAFRLKVNAESEKSAAKGEKPVKVTMLAFLIKAVVATLQKFPEFNSSLDGETQVLKQYWHIGFAADTPAGLLVPVIKDADKKGVLQLARETSELAAKARDGKLSPGEMSGATFSISSLGGIGGTYFTPIINAPEVAILGVCRAAMKPAWDGTQFAPRLILPLSLSWDHRVVDGAGAARFNADLAALLADARRLVL